ncbi:MAG: choice-of-anchor tandem repeat GloVer-containing protein [Terriglobales bacterium]
MSKLDSWKKVCAVSAIVVAPLLTLSGASSAQVFRLRHAFNGTDGANPYAGLVQGTDGNLYGTTIDGGVNGGGNVFKMTPGGKLTSLYDFCSQPNCADGQYPVTTLIEGADGNFYGTAQSGGTDNYGTVFKITPTGTLTTLHSFNGRDGAAPYGSLMLANNGDFYGSADVGGAYGAGTIFTITPAGVLTTLYNFCSQGGCTDGQYPAGQLIQGSDGNLYGVTHAGGSYANCNVDGCGTIFKMTLSGKLKTLHTFDAANGEYPYGGLIDDGQGLFYGTTASGGAGNDGIIFTITLGGDFSTLYSFTGPDGAEPYGMLLGSDGNFYGTTLYGYGDGAYPRGSVFEITPGGTLTNLHTFDGRHGKNPYSGLVQHTNGTFYGTTYFGGRYGNGIVFTVSTGLAPFVETQPASGNVGMAVTILGTKLKGATAVSFNGSPAAFTVVSSSEILTNVPAGAKTGTVSVTTSKDGTLKSNVAFRVTR